MNEEYISDSEIRVIGGSNKPPQRPFPWRWAALGIALAIIIGLITWLAWPKATPEPDEPGVFEQEIVREQLHPLRDWLAGLDTLTACATATYDITINDIPLRDRKSVV